MKHLKMLGLAAMAAAALMAFAGASTASATTLTNGTTAMKFGDGIHANNSGTVTLTTRFKNIECSGSTLGGAILSAGGAGQGVSVSVSSLTWSGCNCEVKTLAGGILTITGGGTNSGFIMGGGAEITAQCNGTIFGNVHCIYATIATELGSIHGGMGATINISGAAGAHLTPLNTSFLCNELTSWDATYVVDAPSTLNIDS